MQFRTPGLERQRVPEDVDRAKPREAPSIALRTDPASQTIELRREPIENHKMKTRCLDHIDLRVKDMEVARKFYGKFLPQLGFVRERHEPAPAEVSGEDFHTFYSAGGDRPSEFFRFHSG